jgi:hypothetical protein
LHWRRLIAPSALLAAALLLQTLASFAPVLIDAYYSRGLYTHISRWLAFVNKFFGFSVAEVLFALLLACLCVWLTWQAGRLYLRRVRVDALLFSALRGALWFGGGGLLLFLLVWGLNYQRRTLADSLHVERREARADELETISREIIEGVNRNYEESRAASSIDEASRLPLSRAQLFAQLSAAYRRVPLAGDDGRVAYGPPKPVYFSGLMSRMQISGVYSPFTGEPNFNALMPDADMPFTVAHEMAHGRGFAREDEASFIAFLVCINSTESYIRYSGYLNALGVLNLHARVAPERARELYAALSTGARSDIRARYLFWARYQGRLGQMTSRLNNAYLKANRIKSGVKNYNEVNRLIIGYYLLQQTGGAGQATTTTTP